MKNKAIINSINLNLESIYKNLNTIFKINLEEFKTLIANLISFLENDENSNKREFSEDALLFNNLKELNKAIMNLSIDKDEIKYIIINSPIILLYSNKVDNMYFLHKKNTHVGYIVLNEDANDKYLLNNTSDAINNNENVDSQEKEYILKKNDKLS